MNRWWAKLAGYGRHEAAGLTAILALTLSAVGMSLLAPWPLKIIVDNLLTDEPLPEQLEWLEFLVRMPVSNALLLLVGATVTIFAATEATRIVKGYIERGVGDRIMYRLAADVFEHTQRLSLRYHDRHRTGDLVHRIAADAECARVILLGVALPLLTAAISVVLFVGVMWRVSPFLTLMAMLATLPLPWFIRALEPRMSRAAREFHESEGRLMALVEQNLSAMPIVQAFDRRPAEVARFRGVAADGLRTYLRSIATQLQFKIGVSSFGAVGTAAILLFGALAVMQGTQTVGSLLVFLAYLSSLYAPMETMALVGSAFALASGRARRVFEVLDSEEVVEERAGAVELRKLAEGGVGEVRFERVTVGYEAGRPVLQDISLRARPGEVIAFVGRTGAGKSTLVSLLPRFLDPWEGRVTVGGQDLRDLTLSSLRSQIGLVLQDSFLLPLSVADNIAYGRPDATPEEIVAAARAANAEEFIRTLPDGYDTVLGERGATLSGGQSQRLSIARALLKDAPILILDEPTSALDAETEALLLSALKRLVAGRTTFIIAHRLSTIRHADQIILLDNGRIAERGSHDELLLEDGAYARFHRTQALSGSTG